MGAPQTTSIFSCDLRIVRAKNIELKNTNNVFVRCYLSAGNKERVQINSHEISSKSDLYWDQLFSLDCSGTDASVDMLKQGNIVIELRRRRRGSFSSILGRVGSSSQILGTAEIPWRTVFESETMKTETWITMVPKNKLVHEDVKPPAVQIAVEVSVGETRTRRKDRLNRLSECGCMDGRCDCLDYVDYDMFALGIALEAL